MSTPKIKGVPVEMGGEVYIIPPLTLGRLDYFRERIAKASGDGANMLNPDTQRLALEVVHAALVRNYPDMTVDAVGEILDLGNMGEAFTATMDVSGVMRKAAEAAASGEASRATGPT